MLASLRALRVRSLLLAGAARFALPRLLERVARVQLARALHARRASSPCWARRCVAEQIGLTLAVGAFIGGLVASLVALRAPALRRGACRSAARCSALFFTAVGMLFDPQRGAGSRPRASRPTSRLSASARRSSSRSWWRSLLRRGRADRDPRRARARADRRVLVRARGEPRPRRACSTPTFEHDLRRRLARHADRDAVPLRARRRGSRRRPRGSLASEGPAEASAEAPGLRDHALSSASASPGRTVARVLDGGRHRRRSSSTRTRARSTRAAPGAPRVVFGDADARAAPRARRHRGRAHGGRRRSTTRSRRARSSRSSARSRRACRSSRARASCATSTRSQRAGADASWWPRSSRHRSSSSSEVLRLSRVTRRSVARFARELREEGYEALRAPVGLALDPWLAELLVGARAGLGRRAEQLRARAPRSPSSRCARRPARRSSASSGTA